MEADFLIEEVSSAGQIRRQLMHSVEFFTRITRAIPFRNSFGTLQTLNCSMRRDAWASGHETA